MTIVAINVLNLPITHLKPYCFLYLPVLRYLPNDGIKLTTKRRAVHIQLNLTDNTPFVSYEEIHILIRRQPRMG